MKTVLIGVSALLIATAAAYAADPAKVMDSSAGKIWTDQNGMTLYTYDKDAAGKSNCYDKCATNWPPLKAAADAKAMGEWTVVERKDGTKMWAYDGHPLYTFIMDKKVGDVTGEGKADNTWHIAKAD
ncbi:hypothetical protein [Mesorhizobium sp. CN2-181]|uniref:COG4315 family predicted lipoprotein n=1 Tax=Mesorhizobium yinganensis TaxID=3157707 RepID=UPI0032B71CF2